MAIQFNCPYCTAGIRVADDAAGKVGTCPKCATKLRVPTPPSPPQDIEPVVPDGIAPKFVPESDQAVEPEQPAAADPIPDFVINTESSPVTSDPNRSPFDFSEPPARSGETSYADQLRRRRGRNWGALIMPLICGAILIGVGVAYWWTHRDTMTGEFAGELLDRGHPLVAVVPTAVIDLPDAELKAALDAIREAPVTITSELMYVEFRGDARGIRVLLEPGPEASLVRADLRPNRLLAEYYADHAGELDAVRRDELEAGATQFVEDWQSTNSSGMLLGNTLAYRDSLGLNGLLKGLGFHVGAVVGETLYPCVHEDGEGRLYFIVPRGTSRFEIRERPSDSGRRLPKEFGFTITVSGTDGSNDAPPADDEATPSMDSGNSDAPPTDSAADGDEGDDVPAESQGSEAPTVDEAPESG